MSTLSLCSWTWTRDSSFNTSWWILRCVSWEWQWIGEGLWAMGLRLIGSTELLSAQAGWHLLRPYITVTAEAPLKREQWHLQAPCLGHAAMTYLPPLNIPHPQSIWFIHLSAKQHSAGWPCHLLNGFLFLVYSVLKTLVLSSSLINSQNRPIHVRAALWSSPFEAKYSFRAVSSQRIFGFCL